MAFSKPDSEKSQLQKSVDAARDACRWMETELATAQKNAADALNASRKAIRDRNISAALEQKQLAADLRVSNLAAELDHARIDLDALEKELDRCRKTKQCQQDAAEFDKRVTLYADKGDVAIKAIAEWAEAMKPLTPDLPDLLASYIFFSNVAVESPVNREMNLTLARQRRNAILAGAATLSRPAPPPAPNPLPPPVIHVCTLKPITWLDHQGAAQIASAGVDVDLPIKVAERGIAINAVCGIKDERRKSIKAAGTLRIGTPLFRNCIQLSEGMIDPDSEPFRKPVRRSVPPNTVDPRLHVIPPNELAPPRQAMVARNDLQIATRNKGKDQEP
jgi:hypothetical protein